jgi:hypothetical protein
MKALKNKVILSAVVLLFALVATIGSTYAWFTISNEVEVKEMTLNVQAADNLLIRVANPAALDASDTTLLNASTYYQTITTDLIKEYFDYTGLYYAPEDTEEEFPLYAPWSLHPVTAVQSGYATIDAKTLNSMTISSANLVRDLVTTTAKNQEGGKFIELNFWLYAQTSDGNPINVTLKDLTITSSADAPKNDVVNAVRVAIWGDNSAFNVAGAAGDAYIFGIDNDYGYAFVEGRIGYSSTAAATTPLVDPVIGTTEFNFIDQIQAETEIVLTDHLFFTSGAAVVGASTETLGSAQTLFALNPDEPTLFTVRIYIEGWDENTTDDINAADFNISFNFVLQ